MPSIVEYRKIEYFYGVNSCKTYMEAKYFAKALKGDNNPLFYLITLLLVIPLGYMIGGFPLIILQQVMVDRDNSITTADVDKYLETLDFSIINVHSNIGLIFMITIFVFTLLAFMLAIKHLHKRPFKYLITPHKRIDFNKIFFGFGLWFVIMLCFEAIMAAYNPDVYYLDFKPVSFIFLLFICVLLLPIQTSTEELVMRGYFMPFVAYITTNKIAALLISSIVFGIIHGMNPEVEKFGFWTMQLYYITAGLLLGLITILDDSLELALGVHAATNVIGASLFSFEGSVLQTDSLFKVTEVNPLYMAGSFIVGSIIFVYICFQKYSWSWASLTEKVDNNIVA